jgi:4-hydroxy-2-oxoglutarate aldolase
MVTESPKFEGIFAPVPTPFEPSGERVALGRLRENLARWIAHGLTGVLVLGSNGELPHLDDAEADAVIAAARGALPAGRTLLVGAGRPSTLATIAATRRAFDLGADGVLVVTPSYYRARMTPDTIRRHYEDVARAAAGPIFLYHVPAFTGLDVPVDLLLRLGSEPRVRGVKDSSGALERIVALAAGAPPGFAVLTGSAGILARSLAAGAAGGIVAAACVMPAECVELWRASRAGEGERVAALQAAIDPLARAVTLEHGIAGLKRVLDWMGYYGGPVRAPLRELPPEQELELRACWERSPAAPRGGGGLRGGATPAP